MKQGNPTIGGQPVILNTTSAAVADPARQQALSASLTALVEKHVLGYPTFSTITDYAAGDTVFYDRRLYTFTAAHTAGVWDATEVEETDIHTLITAAIADALESGELTPAQAENLESWAEDYSETTNQWADGIRTTGGSEFVATEKGGVLNSIVAIEDGKCDGLATTGYNQLRLQSNGGQAKALGASAWVIPVPKLTYREFGSSEDNNGMLFTGKPEGYVSGAMLGGASLQPTVRFVPLASGEPTSASAGTVITPRTVVYNDKTYYTYETAGPGWLIVSGITYADTCAHFGWEDWYDRFVSPTDDDDAGDSIGLTALFTAAPNGTGKFLAMGNVATRADRISETQMRITDPISRVTSPSWTNTENESTSESASNTQTYTHTVAVTGAKVGGKAQIEGHEDISLTIESATLISYTDTSATAPAGALRFELDTPATATVTLDKTTYALDDCGVEMKVGAVGSAYFECSYSQNVADALSQIAKVRLDSVLRVIAEAIAALRKENEQLKALLQGEDNATLPKVKAQVVEFEEQKTYGVPRILVSSTAGAPSAANVPDNWDEEAGGVWYGCPRFVGQQYIDKTSKKVYEALTLTDSTADWVALN